MNNFFFLECLSYFSAEKSSKSSFAAGTNIWKENYLGSKFPFQTFSYTFQF